MIEYLNPTGITTYQNSLQIDGQIIHAVNVFNPGQGIIQKRGGYSAFQGTLGAQVNSLFSFPHQDGTTLQVYAAAGSLLYYSAQGTAPWAIAQGSTGGDAGGTIGNGQHVGWAILNNNLIIGDDIGSTRNTTTGTTFANTSLAPVAQYLTQYNNRIYATSGTNSTMTYSSYGSADNWSISLPADSSSLTIPDEGAAAQTFVAGDRLNITKTRGKMFNWDTTSLVDMSTRYGPSSPWAVSAIDDDWFYTNDMGIFHYDGANRTLISNAIQNQFYNSQYSIPGSCLGTAPSTTYLWDYLVAVGSVTDNFVGRTINNAIIKYDFIKDQYHNWSFADAPTAMHSYIDVNKKRQFIFGNAAGQVFQFDRTSTSDNGVPIQSEIVLLFNYASQQTTFSPTSASAMSGSTYQKKWNWFRGFFDPGDECNIQFAFSDTLTYSHLKWSEAINLKNAGGPNDYWSVSDGIVWIRFPNDSNNLPRSTYLFIRIYDDSDNSAWRYRGCAIEAEPQIVK